ncbi:IS3 family transposase [Salinicoccus sp. CNSTN-B1]
MESFHSNLKSEAFIYTRFNSLSNVETISRVNQYLKYYNEERIQEN